MLSKALLKAQSACWTRLLSVTGESVGWVPSCSLFSTSEPGAAHGALSQHAVIKTKGLICCSSQGSQKTKKTKTAVTFSIISILYTITHCVPALSTKADTACLWHKTTWCWAGSDRHTPGKFPFLQVAKASLSFPLPKAYTYLTSIPDNCQSLHTLLKNWDVKTEKKKKLAVRQAQELVCLGKRHLVKFYLSYFQTNHHHMKKTQCELLANHSPKHKTETPNGNCSTPFSERNVCKQPF